MTQYSAFRLFREGLRGHKGWGKAWRSPKLQDAYDIVIIGGGGHGLATAYYLARNHGIRRVAVLEKGLFVGFAENGFAFSGKPRFCAMEHFGFRSEALGRVRT